MPKVIIDIDNKNELINNNINIISNLSSNQLDSFEEKLFLSLKNMKCFQSEFEKDLGEEDKTECQKKVLSENVSTLTLKYTTMVSILLGLALVVFQIVAIVASLPLSFLGAG